MTPELRKPKFRGVAYRFILAIAIFSTFLALLGTCLQLYQDYRQDIANLRQQLSNIETSHQNSLSNELWLFNDHGVQAQLEGILALPMVQNVLLQQTDGTRLSLGRLTAHHYLTHRIHLNYRHRDNLVPLGTLQITASTDQIIERIKTRAWFILASQFVQVSFVSAFLYLLFHYLVARHLTTMARHTAGITTANLDRTCHLQRKEGARHDELDQLVSALNGMQGQLFNYLNERAEIEKKLREEIEERRRMEDTLHEQATLLEDEIAQRQRTQEELQLLNNTLEERVTTAVAELRHKEDLLLQQNRLAAMGELLTSIAHQWRQPLNNIAAYIQNMQFLSGQGELTKEEMNRDITAVMDILLAMSHTIDDFRSFFLKDRTQREFVLAEIVDKTLNMIRSALDDSGIRLSVTATPDIRALGYPNEYAQTLMNIIYNARDVLVERGIAEPEICIAISQQSNRSLLTVSDNAGGVPEQILPQIFEPYFTTKGPGKGTGLGLYMAKIMIERNMGGSLTVRNLAAGAEFRIEL